MVSEKLKFWVWVADDIVWKPGILAWWGAVAPGHLASTVIPAFREVKLKTSSKNIKCDVVLRKRYSCK